MRVLARIRMYHRSLAVVLLLLPGGPAALFADEEDLYSAEWTERRLEKNPRNESDWVSLVESRLKDRDFARAEKALKDWKAKVAKPSPNIERMRGEVAFARDALSDAIEAWLRYVKAAPKDWEARVRLAQAYERKHEWKDAIRELSAAIEINPSAPAFAQRAVCRIREQDWPAAEKDIREANRLDATESRVRKFLPLFERGREWLPAVNKLTAAIEQEPGNFSFILDRAEWLVGVGFHDAGLDDIQRVLKANPKSLRAQLWNGVILWERGEAESTGAVMKTSYGKFTKEFRTELKAIDASPDREARAWFLLKHEQPLLALLEVSDSEGSPARAQALFQLDRLPAAGLAARRAVELHPDDSTAWLTLGRLELQNGNIQQALEALNRSTKIKRSAEADELRETASQRLGTK
jgi:tetratricopeptide (TPR) repeat protein